ncbi:hypothetical protein BJ742DRAFT_350571 [Cladochytrium replicatum]|nr:hypothetical protein BJ742DRAFT_350571 [Cladochytrium replicatum]
MSNQTIGMGKFKRELGGTVSGSTTPNMPMLGGFVGAPPGTPAMRFGAGTPNMKPAPAIAPIGTPTPPPAPHTTNTSPRPLRPRYPPPMNDSYQEFRLVAGESGDLEYHIMKLGATGGGIGSTAAPSKQFDLSAFAPPVRLLRQNVLEAIHQQREESTKLGVESGSDDDAKQIRADGFDPRKVSSVGNAANGANGKKAFFKKKMKMYSLPRDEADAAAGMQNGDEDPDAAVKVAGKRGKDRDRFPWVLTDGAETKANTWIGNAEAGVTQSSQHYLFVLSSDGFKVIPASRWYKFTQKPTYQTLTLEEAEAKMNNKRGPVTRRWVMKEKQKGDDEEDGVSSKKIKLEDLKMEMLSEPKAPKPPSRPVKRERDNDGEEIDFEENFEDDEEIDLGVEDEEEKKDAEKRMWGGKAGKKAHFDDDDDDEFFDSLIEEVSRKVEPDYKEMKTKLRKLEKYDNLSDDDENPYLSEDDEEYDVEKEKQKEKERREAAGAAAVAAITATVNVSDMELGVPSADPPGPSYPLAPPANGNPVVVKSEPLFKAEPGAASPTSPTKNLENKKRKAGEADDVVIKKQRLEKHERQSLPSKPSPAPDAKGLLREDDIVQVFRDRAAANGTNTSEGLALSVKELISALKGRIKEHPDNKELVKTFFKTVVSRDKESQMYTLKDTYKF